MGNCLGSPSEGRREDQEASGEDVALGKSRRLNTSPPQWSLDERLTKAEVQARRAEFWETSPAFEGRKEIWEALKAACDACENSDFDLAQAIVDGAGISLPRGTLAEVYDELGNRYVVPNYCLAYPPALQHQDSHTTLQSTVDNVPTDAAKASKAPASESPTDLDSSADKVVLKIRLSSLKDVKISVRSTDTLTTVKRKLGEMESFDGSKVRIFLTGKLLSDTAPINSLKIPKGFFLQAHVPA